MCFSAQISFTSGALLIPAGIYCMHRCMHRARSFGTDFLPLASFPLFFGLQQVVEGMVWLSLGSSSNSHPVALGFLFFALFFWPFWVPMTAWRLERSPSRRRWLAWITLLGLLFGATLYLPLLVDGSRMQAIIVQHSIAYPSRMVTDGLIPRPLCCSFYVLLTTLPLLFASLKSIRLLGLLVFVSAVISLYFFRYAFVSVWCLFAALLSFYLLHFFYHYSASLAVSSLRPQ